MTPLSDTDVADLAGAVYDAALQPALWPSAVERIRRAFGVLGANVGTMDPRTLQAFIVNAGLDPAYIESYR